MDERLRRLMKKLSEFRYVFLVAAAGLLLLLWPSSARMDAEGGGELPEETRIAQLLTEMEGVGAAGVLLSDNGAVVVCPGAADPAVCLRITQAVMCYTGLGASDVRIFKSESNGG